MELVCFCMGVGDTFLYSCGRIERGFVGAWCDGELLQLWWATTAFWDGVGRWNNLVLRTPGSGLPDF